MDEFEEQYAYVRAKSLAKAEWIACLQNMKAEAERRRGVLEREGKPTNVLDAAISLIDHLLEQGNNAFHVTANDT